MAGELRVLSLVLVAATANGLLRPRSRKGKRLLGLLAVLSFLKWWFSRVWAPKLNNRKVIFLGPGCGHIAYTLGFVDALLADKAIRDALVTSGAVFGGVSSGAQAAAFAMAALNGVFTMRGWYNNHMRKGYELLRTNSTLVMGREMKKASYDYYTICKERLGKHPPWLEELVVGFTGFFSLQPIFLTKFDTARDCAQALTASAFVPAVMGLRPWFYLSAIRTRVFDGYLGLWSARFPDNYMFISFLHTVPKTVLRNKHYLRAYKYDTSDEYLAVKSFPWGDTEWADAAFERGHSDFVAAGSELREEFLTFLKDSEKE